MSRELNDSQLISPQSVLNSYSSSPSSSTRRCRANSRSLYSNTAEDQALDRIAKEAEARLAARRQARAEAREIRMKELEKQQKELEETSDRHYELTNDPLRCNNSISATKTPVSIRENRGSSSYASSRRSSEDSLDATFYDGRELRHQLNEFEERFRKAMISNAQLDNEKTSYSYQVDLYKDDLEEMEENFIRIKKDYKDKSRAYDQLNRDYQKLQNEFDYIKECLRQRDDLIEEAGLVLIAAGDSDATIEAQCSHMNGDISDKHSESYGDESGSESGINSNDTSIKMPPNVALVSREAEKLLSGIEGQSLEGKLRCIFAENKAFIEEISQLKMDLFEEKQKAAKIDELSLIHGSNQSLNGTETKLIDAQREANKLISDYKFKLKKCEQEINTLQGNVNRLETQLVRYKTLAEDAEKVEDDIKADKRKLQREVREAQTRIDELETTNAHLQKRIDKLKCSRNSVTLKQ